MTMKPIGKFVRASDGNVMIMAAFAIVPIMVLIGAVIDYSRDLRVKTVLQAAVDAASLNTARQSPGLTTDQMLAIAQQSVAANFNLKGVGIPLTTLIYTPAGNANATIKVSASVSVPTTFMSLFGVASNAVGASSTSTWGNSKLRVALALDNTGSMANDGKMDALKTATKNLLASLKAAAVNDGDVYVSIIPFAKVVNVGTSNASASWIRWDLKYSYMATDNKGQRYRQWDLPPKPAAWDGSIADREEDYDVTNTPQTNTANAFPAGQGVKKDNSRGIAADPTPTSLMGLTYDWTALDKKVDAMVSVGGTNQVIGIAWAWQSLTGGAPLNAPPKDTTKYSYIDAIIILTDGLNTENRIYGQGNVESPEVNTRQAALCNKIKGTIDPATNKPAFIVYAVQVNTTGDPLQTNLQNCASDPSKFVMLTTADQIITTFASIGASLSQLHLSR